MVGVLQEPVLGVKASEHAVNKVRWSHDARKLATGDSGGQPARAADVIRSGHGERRIRRGERERAWARVRVIPGIPFYN